MRERKRVPRLLLVSNLRSSMEAILQRELETVCRASRQNRTLPLPLQNPESETPIRVTCWHGVIRKQLKGSSIQVSQLNRPLLAYIPMNKSLVDEVELWEN
jgi:hypothetical protein